MKNGAGEVAPGVFRLGNRFVNWWLIRDDDGATLVDAGLRKHREQLAELLKVLGLSAGDVKAVLLTHADIDHIGVAEQLRREEGVRAYVHPPEEIQATGTPRALPLEFAANMWRSWVRDTAVAYARDGALGPEFLADTSPLTDADVLDVPGRPRVVHCPGHTPGSCAFALADRGVVLTGDALVTVNMVTGETGPQLMPAFDNEDRDAAVASLDRLAATGAEVVLTGHGEPWTHGIDEAVAAARAVLALS